MFMCPLHMGIDGAALATAIGPVISVLILLPHFLGRNGELYLTWAKGSKNATVRILFLGMAEDLQPVFKFFLGAGEDKRNITMRKFAAKIFLLLGVA